jgi:hypothetical protein
MCDRFIKHGLPVRIAAAGNTIVRLEVAELCRRTLKPTHERPLSASPPKLLRQSFGGVSAILSIPVADLAQFLIFGRFACRFQLFGAVP